MGAAPSGMPGWPLLAFCTASTDRKRIVFTQSSSSFISSTFGHLGGAWLLVAMPRSFYPLSPDYAR